MVIITIYIDINECENDNGRCSDICTNTIGSYHCDCHSGYHLSVNDNKNCIGND